MIIVSGSGRSGTSMIMQTMKIWGLPIAGVPFHSDFPVRELNPKGYWDLPVDILREGIDMRYKGMVVKLFGGWLSAVDSKHIDKMIVCKRRCVASQDKSMMNAFDKEAETQSDSKYRELMLKDAPKLNELQVRRRKNYRDIRKFLNRNKHIDHTQVYIEDVIDNPEEKLNEIANFIDRDIKNMEKAIENIDRR